MSWDWESAAKDMKMPSFSNETNTLISQLARLQELCCVHWFVRHGIASRWIQNSPLFPLYPRMICRDLFAFSMSVHALNGLVCIDLATRVQIWHWQWPSLTLLTWMKGVKFSSCSEFYYSHNSSLRCPFSFVQPRAVSNSRENLVGIRSVELLCVCVDVFIMV